MGKMGENGQKRNPADTGGKMLPTHGVETGAMTPLICPQCLISVVVWEKVGLYVCRCCQSVFYAEADVKEVE